MWLFALSLITALEAGQQAPEFRVQDTEGRTLTLSELTAHGPVVLAFFPKAFTSGCTRELTSYTARFSELKERGATLLAVSTDDAATLKRFKAELKAPFAFIPDPDGQLVTLFDVKTPLVTYAKRRTFVIGKDRRILRVDEGNDAVDPQAAIKACNPKD